MKDTNLPSRRKRLIRVLKYFCCLMHDYHNICLQTKNFCCYCAGRYKVYIVKGNQMTCDETHFVLEYENIHEFIVKYDILYIPSL